MSTNTYNAVSIQFNMFTKKETGEIKYLANIQVSVKTKDRRTPTNASVTFGQYYDSLTIWFDDEGEWNSYQLKCSKQQFPAPIRLIQESYIQRGAEKISTKGFEFVESK